MVDNNDICINYGSSTLQLLKASMRTLGITFSVENPQRLRNSYGKRAGNINRISFVFPRHYVYVHKGVGRGTGISEAGSTNRKAKPWFNPVIEVTIEKLADDIAANTGDTLIQNIFI